VVGVVAGVAHDAAVGVGIGGAAGVGASTFDAVGPWEALVLAADIQPMPTPMPSTTSNAATSTHRRSDAATAIGGPTGTGGGVATGTAVATGTGGDSPASTGIATGSPGSGPTDANSGGVAGGRSVCSGGLAGDGDGGDGDGDATAVVARPSSPMFGRVNPVGMGRTAGGAT
jgi:hypothetical protein